MLQNHLKLAYRNIRKKGFYSALNVFGLWAGILFALLIGAHVWGELQVNQQLRNADRQYFLTSIWRNPNIGMEITSAGPLGKRLKEVYPQLVANYYRWDGIKSGVAKGDKVFRENIQIGDSTLLTMFGFGLLHGDPNSALKAPYSVVITAEKALKYFGKTDVVGQTLSIQNFTGGHREFMITGVLGEIPENSVTDLLGTEPNSLFISFTTARYFFDRDVNDWNNIIYPTYLELQPGVTGADLEKPIQQLIQQEGADFEKENLTVHPIALKHYHLQKNKALVKRMLFALSSVGIFILFMAIFNFINLAIGRSGSRIREIGVRKALGGLKQQLAIQFLAESLLLVAVATALAFLSYPLAQMPFEQIVGKSLPVLTAFPMIFALLPFALVLVVGLLAGLYPALFLSSMKTVESLKGKLGTANQSLQLRKYLVGFQFGVANLVIIAALVVAAQVNYFFGKNIGYNQEFVVTAQVPRDWSPEGLRKMLTVRDEMAKLPGVRSASLSFEIPNGNNQGQPSVYRTGTDSTTAVVCQQLTTDEHYLDTYQISLLEGEYFNPNGRNYTKVVLNERAALAIGFPDAESAIGQTLRMPGDPMLYTIKGVLRDFHFGSMATPIQPMVVFPLQSSVLYRYLSFKIEPEGMSKHLVVLQKKWAELLPGSAFEYTFMDDTLAEIYAMELQMKRSAYVASALALLIALLGVLGLVSLNLQRREKEVGVRKVLGASVSGIIGLFLQEFLLILLFAGIAACPLAWYLLRGWLENYAYHIELSPLVFAASLLGLAAVTAILISLQSVKAAFANPIKSLRNE
ncbi:ABC transporter permease [Haliscomenobacter sp.]|uniref:ABC transporter permease n=1 Tax=Haliscomenobacter sp. TaxID=2717303 RepID=UPI00359329CF